MVRSLSVFNQFSIFFICKSVYEMENRERDKIKKKNQCLQLSHGFYLPFSIYSLSSISLSKRYFISTNRNCLGLPQLLCYFSIVKFYFFGYSFIIFWSITLKTSNSVDLSFFCLAHIKLEIQTETNLSFYVKRIQFYRFHMCVCVLINSNCECI